MASLSTLIALQGVAYPASIPEENPEIVVTAARLPERTTSLSSFLGSASVVSRREIEESRAITIAEVLRLQPGFTSMDIVGMGVGVPKFGFRGYGDKSGAIVLVDGVRANDIGEGFFAGASVPPAAIERIEILRGGASTIFGEGAAAGVINIVTRDAGNRPLSGTLGAGMGNWGFNENALTLSGRQGDFSLFSSASRNGWEGWREGSRHWQRHFLVKPSWDSPVGKWTLGYQFSDESSEVPDQLTPDQAKANPRQRGRNQFVNEQQIHRGYLNYRGEWVEDWILSAKAFANQDRGLSKGFATLYTDQPSYGITAQGDWKRQIYGKPNHLVLGGEWVRQDFSQISQGTSPVENAYDVTNAAVFIQDTLSITRKLTMSLGSRLDSTESDIAIPAGWTPGFIGKTQRRVWSPKLVLSYEFRPESAVWLSLSKAYSKLSANDVISSAPALFSSNPTLRPLSARTLEIGVRSRLPKAVSLWASAYRSWVRDDIFSDLLTVNSNADAIRQGAEAGVAFNPTDWLGADWGLSYTDAHFSSGEFSGRRQVLVPKWTSNAGITVRPSKQWMLRLETLWVSGVKRFYDLQGELPREDYALLNARIQRVWGAWSAYFAVNNLCNRRYEMFTSSYPSAWSGNATEERINPSPGRHCRLGVEWRF
ncbi:MAG: hypothetical protein RLZZ142_2398 [Verrucomicrobiota bacterium]